MAKEIAENINSPSKISVQEFGELYAQYRVDMYRFAYFYLGSPEEAEDAVSETVVIAFEKVRNLRDPDAFKSWIFKILFRNCKQRLRGFGFSKTIMNIDDVFEDGDDRSDEVNDAICVRNEINALPKRERAIIWLSVICGYKSTEIGQITGLSPENVRVVLHRTLIKLRSKIDKL